MTQDQLKQEDLNLIAAEIVGLIDPSPGWNPCQYNDLAFLVWEKLRTSTPQKRWNRLELNCQEFSQGNYYAKITYYWGDNHDTFCMPCEFADTPALALTKACVTAWMQRKKQTKKDEIK